MFLSYVFLFSFVCFTIFYRKTNHLKHIARKARKLRKALPKTNLRARRARRASGASGILKWAHLLIAGLQLLANQPASQPPAAGRQPNGRARDPNRWRRNPQHRTAKPHRLVGFCRPGAQGAQAAQDAQAAQPRPLSDLLLYNL